MGREAICNAPEAISQCIQKVAADLKLGEAPEVVLINDSPADDSPDGTRDWGICLKFSNHQAAKQFLDGEKDHPIGMKIGNTRLNAKWANVKESKAEVPAEEKVPSKR